ncbi:MAG: hypothetical protein LN568_03695 [Rickettsia endosymbiont of Pseudomimeciton antennatum]|nr:hypothetical protein [Rickettsia endosymbiont of Pseudomimeciton antennatum]
MTVHIFRYSQLIDTKKMRTIEAFAVASGLSEKDIAGIALEEETEEDGIISRYKRGKIDDKTFRQELNKAIVQKGGTKLEDDVFDDCWNAMCTVDSSKMSKLHQLQLKHEGCKIHIIGDTNALQYEFIIKKIASLEKKPEIDYTLSFKEYTSNRKAL